MWYLSLIRFAIVIVFLLYYGVILFETLKGEDMTYTGHSMDNSKIWIPFYIWFNKPETKKKRK